MKPVYVTVEFWRKDKEDTATIEGWLTTDFLETRNILITPSIDYDEAMQKIAISWDKIVSITPAQSIREYRTGATYALGYEVGDNDVARTIFPTDEYRKEVERKIFGE